MISSPVFEGFCKRLPSILDRTEESVLMEAGSDG